MYKIRIIKASIKDYSNVRLFMFILSIIELLVFAISQISPKILLNKQISKEYTKLVHILNVKNKQNNSKYLRNIYIVNIFLKKQEQNKLGGAERK